MSALNKPPTGSTPIEVDRWWVRELAELGRRMDAVEKRIDELVARLLPS